MSRPSINSMFKDKTIKSVNTRASNMWVFYFTDGTRQAIETEHVGIGLYGFALVPESDLMVLDKLPKCEGGLGGKIG